MPIGGHFNHPWNHGWFLVAFSFLVVFALSTSPSVVSGSTESGSINQNSTEISECQRISEPGRYVLTRDIDGVDNQPCIEIVGTESVVFDGNGFAIRQARLGVKILDSSNVVVKNLAVNESKRVGIGILGSESIEIYGNNISNTGTGQGWLNNSIHSWESSNIEIYDNTVVNSSNYGIYAGRTTDGTIYGNTVINAHWSIFTAESKHIVIDENTVKNPATNGNAIAGTHIINVTVTNNFINQTRYGIEAKPNSTDVVIRDNVIRNTVLCSIEAEGHNPGKSNNVEPGRVTDVIIEGNFMESTGPLGVWVNTSDIVVRNNTVKNASGLGMYVRGIDGPVEIYRNTFINSGSAAIRINGTQGYLHIYENDFRHLDTGLRLVNSAGIRIERNRFTEVTDVFEERNTSGIESHNNTIDTPGQPGFGLFSAVFGFLLVISLARKWNR